MFLPYPRVGLIYNQNKFFSGDPYFASDFENNLAGFWNYQAAIVSGDTWGKAVEFEANDYITSKCHLCVRNAFSSMHQAVLQSGEIFYAINECMK